MKTERLYLGLVVLTVISAIMAVAGWSLSAEPGWALAYSAMIVYFGGLYCAPQELASSRRMFFWYIVWAFCRYITTFHIYAGFDRLSDALFAIALYLTGCAIYEGFKEVVKDQSNEGVN